jgi:putative addiction module component (TIGR02574 family)
MLERHSRPQVMTMKPSINGIDFSQLSAAERLLLAQELLDSVFDDVAPATLSQPQIDELHRRREEMLSGKVQGVPWEQVKSSLLEPR